MVPLKSSRGRDLPMAVYETVRLSKSKAHKIYVKSNSLFPGLDNGELVDLDQSRLTIQSSWKSSRGHRPG